MRQTTYHFSLSEMGDCCLAEHKQSLSSLTDIKIISAHISETTDRELTLIVEDDGVEDFQPMKVRVQDMICKHFDNRWVDCVVKENNLKPSKPFSYLSFFQSHWFLGTIGLLFGFGLMGVCFFFTLPTVAMMPIALSSIFLTAFLGKDSFRQALEHFKQGKLNMDSLFFVSTLAAVIVSLAACFLPGLPMMFDAGLMIFGFRHLGEGIKKSLENSMELNLRFQDRAPKMVKKKLNGVFVETPLEAILVNDEILIEKGTIPVDGICLDANRDLDVSFVNGDSMSHKTVKNQPLFAGMKLKLGCEPIHIRVSAIAADSLLAERDNELANALSTKAPLQLETDRILQYFIPAVFLLASISAVIVGYFYTPALAIECAINVLVSACPCTLSMITSLAMRTGMKKAEDAEYPIQFKNAEELQKANQIKRVVFDLIGTLTRNYEVSRVISLDSSFTETEILRYCLALEKHSSHSIGEATREFALNKNVLPIAELEKSEINDNNKLGLKAHINNKQYIIGDREMMELNQIDMKSIEQADEGTIRIYLACEGKVLGYMVLSAPLREDAKEVITKLKALGKEVHLCTGSSENLAKYYAKILGIDLKQVTFRCQDKKSEIERLGKEITSMVGDAGNDAAAVAYSYFGIAVQSRGYDKMTRASAGAIVRGPFLMPIITAFEVAQQTINNMKQNLLFSLVYNLLAITAASGLLLAAGISFSPGFGAALMIVQSSLVLLNMYRFKQQPLVYKAEELESWTDSFWRMMQDIPNHLPIYRPSLSAQVEMAAAQSTISFRAKPLSQLPIDESEDTSRIQNMPV